MMIIIIETLLKREPQRRSSKHLDTIEENTVKEQRPKILSKAKLNSSDELNDVDEGASPTKICFAKKVPIEIEDHKDSPSKPTMSKKIILTQDEEIDWNDDRWQVLILKPYCESINNTSYEIDQLQMIKHLNLIVQKCFDMLNEEGWTVIINALCSINIDKVSYEIFEHTLSLINYIISQSINSIFGDSQSIPFMAIGGNNLHSVIENLPKYLSHVKIRSVSKSQSNKSKQIDLNKTDSSDELGEFGIIVRIARILDMMKGKNYNNMSLNVLL